jgi:hypothetical protein
MGCPELLAAKTQQQEYIDTTETTIANLNTSITVQIIAIYGADTNAPVPIDAQAAGTKAAEYMMTNPGLAGMYSWLVSLYAGRGIQQALLDSLNVGMVAIQQSIDNAGCE